MFIIDQLEKIRINQYNNSKKKKRYIKCFLALSGAYIVVWYMNREKEKGLLRFQFNKGVCMTTRYKGYNTRFQLRSVSGKVAIEQEFLTYSKFNILMLLKLNPVKEFCRNSLKFLRNKKNKLSNYKIIIN